MLNSRTAVRLGGISGILFVVLVIPSFLSPPDSPIATSGTQDVINYFSDRQDSILTLNGLLLIFAAFFFLWFLSMLHGVLQDAEGEGYGFSSVLLAGGLLFIALVLAGAAVEIVYPATLARFENFQQDAQLGFLSLALSGWMYRFAFVGMAALIAATSVVVLKSGVLPRWLGWAPSRPRRTAAFPGTAKCLANVTVGGSGLCVDAHRRSWVYRRSAHTYRALFLVGTRTDAPHSPS
jgi:hypothetical protein